jgi:hypothetical protein
VSIFIFDFKWLGQKSARTNPPALIGSFRHLFSGPVVKFRAQVFG